jgi:hypothetical protein
MKGLRLRPVAAGRRSWGQPDPGSAGEGSKQPRRSRDGQAPPDSPGPVSETDRCTRETSAKAPQEFHRPQTWRTWAGEQCTPGRATPTSVGCADYEATRKACGVLVAMLQGHSWAPTRRSVRGERGNPPGSPSRRPARSVHGQGPLSVVGLGRGRSPRSSPRTGKPSTWQRRAASSQCRDGMSGGRR